MRGSTYKHCGCRDADGRRLNKACPKLRQRGHGTWYYVITLPPHADGRVRQRRRGGYATQDAAQADLDELKQQARAGEQVGCQLTVGQWLEQWLAGKRQLRSSTRRMYRQYLDQFLIPRLGHLLLRDLRTQHVDALVEWIYATNTHRRRPIGPATLHRIRATLRSALATAARRRLITTNPAALIELPAAPSPRPAVWTADRVDAWQADYQRLLAAEATKPARDRRSPLILYKRAERPPVAVWTPAQTGAFLDHVATDRLYALWHLIAFTGLRRGEAAALRWADLDPTTGALSINEQLVLVATRVETGPPKSASSHRTLALDATTLNILHTHRTRQTTERLTAGPAWTDSGRIFTTPDGHQLNPGYLTKRFDRLTWHAGLPPIRLHDLRHGAATLHLAAGANLKIVQEMLGHSTITLTANTYTSVLPDLARQATHAAIALVPRRHHTPA
jgi:integrase